MPAWGALAAALAVANERAEPLDVIVMGGSATILPPRPAWWVPPSRA